MAERTRDLRASRKSITELSNRSPEDTETAGFVDSASIHGALAALSLHGSENVSEWDRQCLLDTTYLLLFWKIGIVPGPPGEYKGASGPFEHLISKLPALEAAGFRREPALSATKAWLTKEPGELRDAWKHLHAAPEFAAWATVGRELFWLHHVRMNASLFNPEFIPHISRLLGYELRELKRIERMSQDEHNVRRWVKTNLKGEDARIAWDAYVATALIRGRFHEYVAGRNNLHLSGHPLRRFVQRPLTPGRLLPVFNSEEYFVKAIIGSAMLETTSDRRAKAWVDNLVKARASIERRAISLPRVAVDADAERLAAEAARACGISASYSRVRRELEVATALGLTGLLTISVSPWAGPLGPITTAAYRQYRGASVGEDLARFLLDTKRRFRQLAGTVPGRISRLLKAGRD